MESLSLQFGWDFTYIGVTLVIAGLLINGVFYWISTSSEIRESVQPPGRTPRRFTLRVRTIGRRQTVILTNEAIAVEDRVFFLKDLSRVEEGMAVWSMPFSEMNLPKRTIRQVPCWYLRIYSRGEFCTVHEGALILRGFRRSADFRAIRSALLDALGTTATHTTWRTRLGRLRFRSWERSTGSTRANPQVSS